MDLIGLARYAMRTAEIPFTQLSAIQMNRAPFGGHGFVLMLFTDAPNPIAILRVTTDAERAETFRIAYENLNTLRSALPSGFIDSIPKPYLFEQRNGITLFLESAQAGTPIIKLPRKRYFKSKAFPRDFMAITDWVIAFNSALRIPGATVSAGQRDELLSGPIADYRRRINVSAELDDLLSETVAALSDHKIDLAPCHADFCTANVLVDSDNRIRVIDWEQKLTPMWPLADLLHFMNSVWCIRHGRGVEVIEQNYRSLFFSQTHLTRALQQGVSRYVQKFNITPDLIVPLSVIVWVHQALYKLDFVEGFASTPGDADRLMPLVHPLTIFRENHCQNLEILAANRNAYVLSQIVAPTHEEQYVSAPVA
jgi:hypothetical protein